MNFESSNSKALKEKKEKKKRRKKKRKEKINYLKKIFKIINNNKKNLHREGNLEWREFVDWINKSS